MNELDVTRFDASGAPGLPVWGWEIPVYLFLGGLAAGVMIVSALLAGRSERPSRTARLLSFAAPVLVSIGMGALLLDLEHKSHVLRFFLAFRWTSPMSWGSWILVLVYPTTLLFSLSLLDDADVDRLRKTLERVRLGALVRRAVSFARAHERTLRRATLGLGIALGVYTGILLSTLVARPLWNSALLGPLFLASGLSTGIAFLLLFAVPPAERHLLARWDKVAMLLELGLLALFLLGLRTNGAAGGGAAQLLLRGRFTAHFWSLVVIAGLVVPLMLELASERLHRRMAVMAPILVLVGGYTLRWVLVSAGQA